MLKLRVSDVVSQDPGDVPVVRIYRWDLDKTYLKTEFDSIKDLIRTALQKPEDKINVPGAVALLREIKRPRPESRSMVTFISGSPTQMRSILEKKFELDGIQPDAFILKPTLENILKGRLKAVRGQVGYKLEALLRVRSDAALSVPETLFGDDAEQDAFIYSVYADLVSGNIGLDVLRDVLVEAEVYATTMEKIMRYAAHLQPDDAEVDRIFINLDRRSPPGRFLTFGPRIVPIVNYFQAALVLWADETFTLDNLVHVAGGMLSRDDYGIQELANSFQDLLRRRVLTSAHLDRLEAEVEVYEEPDIIPSGFVKRLMTRVRALAPRSEIKEREWVGPPDYIEILRADRALKAAVTQKSAGLFG